MLCNLSVFTNLEVDISKHSQTRRSENDNIPQPLDQWTNSPFTGQRVENCKSFTLTHYLADLLPCTVGQGQSHCASNIISNSHPFHSMWVKPPIPESQKFQYFTLKIQGQGHGWGQSLKSQCESVDSHPFRSMSVSHPIPEIRLFQNLTLKIQGQGHGWGESWKSQHGSNILSTHIPFIPCQSTNTFLRYDFFKI